jgi:hypothetical protein
MADTAHDTDPLRQTIADKDAVIGGVAHDEPGGQSLDQDADFERVAAMSGGQDEADRLTRPARSMEGRRDPELAAEPRPQAGEGVAIQAPRADRSAGAHRQQNPGRGWSAAGPRGSVDPAASPGAGPRSGAVQDDNAVLSAAVGDGLVQSLLETGLLAGCVSPKASRGKVGAGFPQKRCENKILEQVARSCTARLALADRGWIGRGSRRPWRWGQGVPRATNPVSSCRS